MNCDENRKLTQWICRVAVKKRTKSDDSRRRTRLLLMMTVWHRKVKKMKKKGKEKGAKGDPRIIGFECVCVFVCACMQTHCDSSVRTTWAGVGEEQLMGKKASESSNGAKTIRKWRSLQGEDANDVNRSLSGGGTWKKEHQSDEATSVYVNINDNNVIKTQTQKIRKAEQICIELYAHKRYKEMLGACLGDRL